MCVFAADADYDGCRTTCFSTSCNQPWSRPPRNNQRFLIATSNPLVPLYQVLTACGFIFSSNVLFIVYFVPKIWLFNSDGMWISYSLSGVGRCSLHRWMYLHCVSCKRFTFNSVSSLFPQPLRILNSQFYSSTVKTATHYWIVFVHESVSLQILFTFFVVYIDNFVSKIFSTKTWTYS